MIEWVRTDRRWTAAMFAVLAVAAVGAMVIGRSASLGMSSGQFGLFRSGSGAVVPTVSIGFPVNGSVVSPAGFTAGCSSSTTDDLCGSATGQNLQSVAVSIQRPGGDYWNGSAWTTGEQLLTATGTSSWSLGLASANLTDGLYSLRAVVTDGGGNTGSAASSFTFDSGGPSVTSITAASPVNGSSSIAFTVSFSESVSTVASDDFSLTTTGGVAGASVGTVTGSGSTRTVYVDAGTGEGTIRLDLNDSDASIKDEVGNSIATTTFGTGTVVTVDRTAPGITSLLRTGSASELTNATSVSFTLSFSEAVIGVNASDLSLVSSTTAAPSVTSVTSSDGFTYTVLVNTGSGSGLVDLDVINDGSIADPAGNALNGSHTGGEMYTIDKTAPSVISTNRQTPSTQHIGASTTSVIYQVTFSEGVSGVGTGSFQTAAATGTASGTVAMVSPVSSSGYNVTVNTLGGEGDLRLDLKASGTGISDAAGNAPSGGYTSGQVYTRDLTAPAVLSIDRQSPTTEYIGTSTASVTYRVTFSEDVSGVAASSFQTTAVTGTVSGSVSGVANVVASSVYDVTVDTFAGEGDLRLDLNSSGTGITDLAGNAPSGGFTSGAAYKRDVTAPPAPSLTGPSSPTTVTSADFAFSNTEPGVSFECSLDGATFADCTSPQAFSSLSDGSHTFLVMAYDLAGNRSPSASHTWVVDAVPGTVTIDFPSNGSLLGTPTFLAGCGTGSTADACGTSFNAGTGTSQVQVSLLQVSTGLYWRPNGGGAFDFRAGGEYLITATGTDDWSWIFDGAASDGDYTFKAYATDGMSRVSSATSTFTYDGTAPAAPVITSNPPSATTSEAASFSFTSDAGTTTQCSLDGSVYATCSSPQSYTGLPEGARSFGVRALDSAGNVSAVTSYTWRVDLTAPTVSITHPVSGKRYGPSSYMAGCGTATANDICGVADDGANGSGIDAATLKVSIYNQTTNRWWDGTGFAATSETLLSTTNTPASPAPGQSVTWSYGLASGSLTTDNVYVAKAYGSDKVGFAAPAATSTFSYDGTAPTATDIQTTNKVGGAQGKAEAGDKITYTYSEEMAPSSIVSDWDGTSTGVTVRLVDGGGNKVDLVQIFDGTNTTQLALGQVNLQDKGFVTGSVYFSGSSMVMNGNTVEITLGTQGGTGTIGTATAARAMAWTPSASATDLAGNACATTAKTETGATDFDF